jgi:hypothetical protein
VAGVADALISSRNEIMDYLIVIVTAAFVAAYAVMVGRSLPKT